jgi:hypothetical protein
MGRGMSEGRISARGLLDFAFRRHADHNGANTLVLRSCSSIFDGR